MKVNVSFSRLTFKVILRHFMVWLKNWGSALAWAVGEPVVFLIAFGLGLKKFIPSMGGVDYPSFIAPGLISAGAMQVACYECTFGSYSRLELLKVYDAIASTPVMPEEIALADVLWGALKSVIMALIMFLIFAVAGVIAHPFYFLTSMPAIFFTSLTFASVSLLVTSYARGHDSFSYYFTVFITPAFFLSGAFFPVDALPRALQIASRILPVTYAVDVARLASFGYGVKKIILYTLLLAAISLPFVHLACVRIKTRLES